MKSRSWPTVIMLVLDWVIRCNNMVKLFSKDYMLFKRTLQQKVGNLTSVLNVITVYQGGVCYGTAFWKGLKSHGRKTFEPIRAIALNMRQYINHNVHQCSWWTSKSFSFHLGWWFWNLLERWAGWLPSSIMRSFDVLVSDTGSSSFSMVSSKLLISPASVFFHRYYINIIY